MMMKTLVDYKMKSSPRTVERGAWRSASLRAVGLLIAVGVLALGTSAHAVLIGFETSEGFPLQDNTAIAFTGSATPAGVVSNWENNSLGTWRTATLLLWDPSITGGITTIPEGAQYAISGFDGNGTVMSTMDLDNAGNYSLSSFYWAYRGNGDPRMGGNASFVLEYFGLDEASLGTEQFFGGVTPNLESQWTLATVSLPAAVGVPLSKVKFTSTPFPANSGGTFFLDAVTLDVVIPEPSSFGLMGLGGIVAFALRRWKR